MLIQNPDVGQALRDEAKLQLAELPAVNVTPNVQAVIDITPSKQVKPYCVNGATTTSGTGTVLAAKEKVRYVLHGYTASFCKDATCDGADGNIQWNITQDGIVRTFCSLPVLTLTAQQNTAMLFFQKPLVLDENTIIQAANYTFTAGKLRRNIVLYVSEMRT